MPDLLKRRPDGTFDLALSLFRIGEHFGRRFGQEEIDGGVDEETKNRRHARIECARRIVEAIADDESVAMDLRARARYLAGNLAFLDGAYEEAVRAYDRALTLIPGVVDGGDAIGRDAAWNRAIALHRIEDEKDAGKDSGPDANDASTPDASKPDGGDGGHDAGKDSGGDSGDNGGKDAGNDGGQDSAPPTPPDGGNEPPEAGAQPPPTTTGEDEHMLDQLENAPTLQQEEAKRAGKKRAGGMVDK